MPLLFSLIFVLAVARGPLGDELLFAAEAEMKEKVPGEGPLEVTLHEALSRMKTLHPDLRLQEIEIEKAREEVRLVTRAFLPDIDLDYIASSAAGGLGLIVTAARILRPIFSLKSLLLERSTQKILGEKEEVILGLRSLEAEYRMKELYVTLLIQKRLSQVLKENLTRALERFHLKKLHHEEGGLTEEELLREKLALANARAQSEKASALVQQSEFAFRRLLGLGPDEPFSLTSRGLIEPKAFPLSLKECFRYASEHHPLVKAILLEEEASAKRLGKSDPRFLGDSFFVGFGEATDQLFVGRPRLGFTGTLQLYDWGKRKIKKRIGKLDHESLLVRHAKELDRLGRAILEDYLEIRVLTGELKATEADFGLAFESRRREGILQETGRASQADLLVTESELSIKDAGSWQKGLELFLARERLMKDLGAGSLEDLGKAALR